MSKLKLIPLESPEINFKITPLNKKRKIKRKPTRIEIVRNKLKGEKKHEGHILFEKCTLKMAHYLENSKRYKPENLNALIKDLYRAILNLESKKHDLLSKKANRKK